MAAGSSSENVRYGRPVSAAERGDRSSVAPGEDRTLAAPRCLARDQLAGVPVGAVEEKAHRTRCL